MQKGCGEGSCGTEPIGNPFANRPLTQPQQQQLDAEEATGSEGRSGWTSGPLLCTCQSWGPATGFLYREKLDKGS